MGVITFTDEFTSPISAPRLFKALILDCHNLIPKLFPEAIKSIEIRGDGGAGTIAHIYFTHGTEVKNRIDEINVEAYSLKFTLFEGDALGDNLEFVSYDVKYEPTPDGGSKNKMTCEYHTKGDTVLSEEKLKEGKEKTVGMYKLVEAFLYQNPETYA